MLTERMTGYTETIATGISSVTGLVSIDPKAASNRDTSPVCIQTLGRKLTAVRIQPE
jgi:hypothetical protein